MKEIREITRRNPPEPSAQFLENALVEAGLTNLMLFRGIAREGKSEYLKQFLEYFQMFRPDAQMSGILQNPLVTLRMNALADGVRTACNYSCVITFGSVLPATPFGYATLYWDNRA